MDINKIELGKKSDYDPFYDPNKLFPIPRKLKRDEIGVPEVLPFTGYDVWNHYEVSWLNPKGKPVVALATIIYDCNTPNIIESKSMKLYFNSLNNSSFESAAALEKIITNDISQRIEGEVKVSLKCLPLAINDSILELEGSNIDDLDVECSVYHVDADLLSVDESNAEEVLYSNLLKSNCLVTYQPDWGSVQIAYKGKKINREGLLKYLVSFRNHNEFHEQCIERIFMDITRQCQPDELTVYGRYTRRGGVDINPLRTSLAEPPQVNNIRLVRQ